MIVLLTKRKSPTNIIFMNLIHPIDYAKNALAPVIEKAASGCFSCADTLESYPPAEFDRPEMVTAILLAGSMITAYHQRNSENAPNQQMIKTGGIPYYDVFGKMLESQSQMASLGFQTEDDPGSHILNLWKESPRKIFTPGISVLILKFPLELRFRQLWMGLLSLLVGTLRAMGI